VTSLGALTPRRTWLPLTPSTVTVTSSPTTRVSPTRLVKINILLSNPICVFDPAERLSFVPWPHPWLRTECPVEAEHSTIFKTLVRYCQPLPAQRRNGAP